jgi:uncharacterized protein DUF4124
MRTLLFTLISLAASLALAATTVYKWVDESGVIHYSDQPHPNAEKVRVRDPQTYKESGPLSSATAAETPAAAAPTYRGCAVVQPANDESFANPESITVVVQTDPALRGGDQVFVTLDGQPLNDGRPTGLQFSISPVDRGQHTLQAAVKDPDGALLCQAPPITYNVQQASVNAPQNPLRPRPR